MPQSFIGIDGCRAGWCTAIIKDGNLSIHLLESIELLPRYTSTNSRIFIDMPIGLTDSPQGRVCEIEAKRFMPAQYKSSIFLCPSRSAAYAVDYKQANSIQRQITGKGLSIQAWNITRKIVELDKVAEEGIMQDFHMSESHPEMCFAALNGSFPQHKKRTPEGQIERSAIITQYFPAKEQIEAFLQSTKRSQVAKDDVYDAVCLAIAAKSATDNTATYLPAKAQCNENGKPMQIVLPCSPLFRK